MTSNQQQFVSSVIKFGFPLLAFLLPLGLYLTTLSQTYIPVDSAEFAICMHFWGICHPPGFPLYIFLGKIFVSYFALGSVIYRANLLSSIFGALTILVLYLTLVEVKVKKSFALLLSLIFAVSHAFWEYSVSSDVFTFATFLIALTFFFVFKRRFFLASLILGLSASHFYISAVLLPIIVWYQRVEESKYQGEEKSTIKQFSNLAILILFFSLGFFPQVLMYFRMQEHPAINWGHHEGISGFVDYVRRREFGNIFLLSNPALRFSIFNFLKHIWAFNSYFLINFAVILPVLIIISSVFRQIRSKKYIFLCLSFLVIITVQLFLLSTIDPLEKNSVFQINKFYLASLVSAVLLIGISLQGLIDKFFEENSYFVQVFLGFVLAIYLLTNFKVNNYSNNYFSQNLVLDAMSQLPENSLAIILDHTFKFGSWYEQEVNGDFRSVKVLYFPNEKNKDNEKYFPELFRSDVNYDTFDRVRGSSNLGNAEKYILETISRNKDREIYILQGDFEVRFFNYLKPNLRPWGMWWKFEEKKVLPSDAPLNKQLFENLRNGNVKFSDFAQKQQQNATLTYAVSWYGAGIYLASYGEYEDALKFLNKSYDINPQASNIQRDIELIRRTKKLDSSFGELVSAEDEVLLSELGNDLFVLGNFKRCQEVFENLVQIDSPKAENFNNLASCKASVGEVDQARVNYRKALELDPNLEKAKIGLEALGD